MGLTVRDIATSEAWYTDVLGLARLFVEPHSVGEGHTVVMTRPGTALFVGLDHHPEADRQVFSERRTGLDHLALAVETRQDLDRWARHLETHGIDHGPIVEVDQPAAHAQMTFRDPDGIPIEVFWMRSDVDDHQGLTSRAGTRPRTTSTIPHAQLDQQPADERLLEAILAEAVTWPGVVQADSGISVDGARALELEPAAAVGPPEAFMVGREFCHVHAGGDLSLHATLPVPLADQAIGAGWAERHFLALAGKAPATVVLLYAPRDDQERDVVLRLVRASYCFARGRSDEPEQTSRQDAS